MKCGRVLLRLVVELAQNCVDVFNGPSAAGASLVTTKCWERIGDEMTE
jgi:hypothetical protein